MSRFIRNFLDSISILIYFLKLKRLGVSIDRIIKFGCNLIARKRLASTKIL